MLTESGSATRDMTAASAVLMIKRLRRHIGAPRVFRKHRILIESSEKGDNRHGMLSVKRSVLHLEDFLCRHAVEFVPYVVIVTCRLFQ